jgi:hypothetical protein
MSTRRINWQKAPLGQLRLVSYGDWLTEKDLDPIGEWCNATGCGCRTSFDTFKFATEEEITFFLLKWKWT